jgi:hypothetical protein
MCCAVVLPGLLVGFLGFMIFLYVVHLGLVPLVPRIEDNPLLVFAFLIFFVMGVGGASADPSDASRSRLVMAFALMIGLGALLIIAALTARQQGAHQIFASALSVFPIGMIVWLAASGIRSWPPHEVGAPRHRRMPQ